MTQFVSAENVIHVEVELDGEIIDRLMCGKTVFITRRTSTSELKVIVSMYSSDSYEEDDLHDS